MPREFSNCPYCYSTDCNGYLCGKSYVSRNAQTQCWNCKKFFGSIHEFKKGVYCYPCCKEEKIKEEIEQKENEKQRLERIETEKRKQIITEKNKCEDCKIFFESTTDWKKKTNSELEKILSPKCNKKRRMFKRILWKNSQKRSIEKSKKEWWDKLKIIREDESLCNPCKEYYEEKHKNNEVSYSEIFDIETMHFCVGCRKNMEEIKGDDLLSYQIQPPK